MTRCPPSVLVIGSPIPAPSVRNLLDRVNVEHQGTSRDEKVCRVLVMTRHISRGIQVSKDFVGGNVVPHAFGGMGLLA